MVRDHRRWCFTVSRSDQGGWKDEQSVRVIEGDDRTHVIAKGQVYMSWAPGDEGARRMAIDS